MIPASAPTTPAVTRKTDRLIPVTPQRIAYSAQQVRSVTSPYTPGTNLSTPYSPFSLRSVSSSSNGSNLATPASSIGRRRLSLSLSPEVNFNSKSLADIAENWRTRANENGIKVTSGDDTQYEGECERIYPVLSPPRPSYNATTPCAWSNGRAIPAHARSLYLDISPSF